MGRTVTRQQVTTASFVAGGVIAQLAVWLATRPDTGSGDARLVTWLTLEAGVAVVIGCTACARRLAGWTVVGGWTLQVLHYALVVPHGEDDNLWGVLTQMQLLLAALALKLTLVAHDVTGRARRCSHG
jgi:ribose/xylose/arabinose/galactoside ABC-type transport system permease subunit